MDIILIVSFLVTLAVLAWLFWPRSTLDARLDAEAEKLDIGREEYDRLIATASYKAEHKRARVGGHPKRDDRTDTGVDWTPIGMAIATDPIEPAPSSSYTPPSVDFTPDGSTGYDGGGSSGSWDSGSSYSSDSSSSSSCDSGSSSSGGCD